MVVSEGERPKTRGYSLRTRSQAGSSDTDVKENVVPVVDKKQPTTRARGAKKQVLTDQKQNINNINTRTTRAQTRQDNNNVGEDVKTETKLKPASKRGRGRGRGGAKIREEASVNKTTSVPADTENNKESTQITEEVVEAEATEIVLERITEDTEQPDSKQEDEAEKAEEKHEEDEQQKDVKEQDKVDALTTTPENGEEKTVVVEMKHPVPDDKQSDATPNIQQDVIKEKEKKSFFDLPEEEQILIVRKKMEKIIHGKEKDQTKSVDLLRILERMEITEKLLEKS